MPIVVLWLILGAAFLTFKMRFVNFRLFRHAIRVVRGKFDNPDDEGEVTHFQALASALSATLRITLMYCQAASNNELPSRGR